MSKKEIVTLTDRPGAFLILRRGKNNTRIAPHKTPHDSFTVENVKICELTGKVTEATLPDPNYGDSFETFEQLVECVAKKFSNGIFVTGPGGTGKTYTVMKVIQQLNLVPNQDYFIVKGYSTAAAMYNTLYDFKDRLVIFDDCDSIISDDTGLNILKAVLDTYPKRTVSWNTNSPLIRAPYFDFTGRIIFISNYSPDRPNRHFQALRTRVLTVHISGNAEQMRDRCIELLPQIASTLPEEAQKELQEFIQQNYQKIHQLSLRYAVNLVSLRRYKPQGWQDLALRLH
jgi:Cdc6-like AAA superfamily ATPase